MEYRVYYGFIEVRHPELVLNLLQHALGSFSDAYKMTPGFGVSFEKAVKGPEEALRWIKMVEESVHKRGVWNLRGASGGADYAGLQFREVPGLEWEEWVDPETGEDINTLAEDDSPGRKPLSLEALPEMEFPEDIPRPEMWTVEDVVKAVESGYRFLLPFVMGESLFAPNAYYIKGRQYAASGLTVGPDHTPEIRVLPDGWLQVKTYFQPGMVPQAAWIEDPLPTGVVAVYVEIDPETIDWEQLNRGYQIRVPKGLFGTVEEELAGMPEGLKPIVEDVCAVLADAGYSNIEAPEFSLRFSGGNPMKAQAGLKRIGFRAKRGAYPSWYLRTGRGERGEYDTGVFVEFRPRGRTLCVQVSWVS